VVQKVCVVPVQTEAGGGVDVNVVGLTLTDRQHVLVARPFVITTFTTNRPGFRPGLTHTVGRFVGPQKEGVVVPVPGQPSVVATWRLHE